MYCRANVILVLLCSALAAAGCGALRTSNGDAEEACAFAETAIGDFDYVPEQEYVFAPKKTAWELALGGQEASRPYVRARMRGLPAHLLIDRAALPVDDRAFAERLARDTWRGLDALSDRENGLPANNVRLTPGAADPPEAMVGDYASITDIGVHMIALVAARDLGYLSDEEAHGRLSTMLDTLQQLETYKGFFFNYYDTTSLERTSHFISFVDSSWLTAGLIVARNALPSLADRCSELIGRSDYSFFYDPSRGLMSHGYYVDRRRRSPYHYGVLYAESRLGSVLAIGKGEVPAEHWFRMVRTLPAHCAGQTQSPVGRKVKIVDGHEFTGGYYEWNGIAYVPSWGGSMFEALMPTLVFDERRFAPLNLGLNDERHALVQRRYASEVLAYPVWGMSPSSVPGVSTGYSEFGVRVLGMRGYKPGAVTPHASALALAVTPVEALANLRRLAEDYEAYGEYGLYDAVDSRSGSVAHVYLALDQAMTFIALANHLTGGAVQQHFGADPIVQRALPVIASEDFFGP